jgi:hypothetical protein
VAMSMAEEMRRFNSGNRWDQLSSLIIHFGEHASSLLLGIGIIAQGRLFKVVYMHCVI